MKIELSKPFFVETITIIGVGLIGGSLAQALKRAKAAGTVVCYDKNEELMEQIIHKDAIIRKLTKVLEEIEGVAKQTTAVRNQNDMLREKLNLSSLLLERKTEREKIDSYLKVDLKAQ